MKLLPTLALLICTGSLHAASIYTETFSNDGNTEGWFAVTDATTGSVLPGDIGHNPTEDILVFGALNYGVFYAAADATSSGGAFSGNYVAAQIYGVTFKMIVYFGSTVNGLFLELANYTNGVTYQHPFATPLGMDTNYAINFDSPSWTQTTGAPVAFNSFLNDVEEVGFAFTGDGTSNLGVGLDNFATVPEPSSLVLLGCAALVATTRRRRNR